MRILLLGPLPPPMGGDTRHFATLVHDLGSNPDIKMTLFNTSRAASFESRFSNARAALRTAVALAVNLHRVDVVSFHASDRGMMLFAPIVAGACRLWRKPYVLRLFGGSLGDRYEEANRWVRFVIRRTILSAPVVLLQTRRQIGQLEGHSSGRLEWFSTYIDLPANHEIRLKARTDASSGRCDKFVFLGHLWETKGIEIILRSVGELPPGVSVDVYGPEDEYTGSEIDRRGSGSVRYRGFLSHDEVYERLWDYDCLILPTMHPGEGYPGVIAEAFAHGIPVIATRWLAIPEIVDESCGILIEPREVAALAESVRVLHEDPDLWRELCGGAARRSSTFDHARWSQRFESLCDELLNQ